MEVEESANAQDEYRIDDMASVSKVRRKTVALAASLGFSEADTEEIAISVSELATNLIRHSAQNGSILVREITNYNTIGLEIMAVDEGPGIQSISEALNDKHSTGDSMGCGLGAVRRFMDEFDIYSRPSSERQILSGSEQLFAGTIVMGRKWLSHGAKETTSRYAGYSRPRPGFTENGDKYFISCEGGNLFVALVDGLGHGSAAAEVSSMVVEYLAASHNASLDVLLGEVHTLLKGTRGAAANLLRLDREARKLSFSGVGNVEFLMYPRPQKIPFPKPGVLGSGALRTQAVVSVDWPVDSRIMMFSDGVSARWGFDRRPELLDLHPSVLCRFIVQQYGRNNDDATAIALEG